MLIKNKIKIIVIIVILILLFVNFNFGFVAQTSENKPNSKSNAKFSPRSNENSKWKQIEIISEPFANFNLSTGVSGDPNIAVENGKIYVVWHDNNETNGAGTDWDIFYRHFDGNNWSEIQVISEPVIGENRNAGWSVSPSIDVENGIIHVVWKDYNNTNGAGADNDIFYRCNLTGSSWEPVQVISEPILKYNNNIGISWDPVVEVENESIYVVWYDNNNTNGAGDTDYDIFFRCNLSGTNWSNVQVISEPVSGKDFNIDTSRNPTLAVENGKIFVVWEDENNTKGAGTDFDIFYRCNVTGYFWEEIQVISEPVASKNFNIGVSWYVDIAVENGTIYVVWEDTNNTDGAGNDEDIFYRCNITNNSWENIQVISEPAPNQNDNSLSSKYPAISVEKSKIYIVWCDETNLNGSGIDTDIFYICNISGYNWNDIQVISEPEIDNNLNNNDSNFPDIAVKSEKNHVFWRDKTNFNGAGTDYDVFYRNNYFPPILTIPNVTPKIGNTSTIFSFTVIYNHAKNIAPKEVIVNINGMNYSMIETDPNDTEYTNGKNFYYNIKLNISLNNTYQFFAFDGNYTEYTILDNNPDVYNTVPKIITENNIIAIEDVYYEILYEYEDIDIQNVAQLGTWNFSTNATWLSFNPTTAMLYGTPTNDDFGSYWVNISINDTMDMDFTNFTLTVLNINDNPLINTTNVEITYEDELYEVDYNATDVDNLIENQVWSLATNASSWLNIDSITGILNGTPTNDDVGDYWVNVSVADGDGGFGFANFTLSVLNVNDPPVIITYDIIFTNESELYKVDYNATDVDSAVSKQTWALETNATWLSIDPSTGVLSGTPVFNEIFEDKYIIVAWWTVNVTVSDGDGGSDRHEFILFVFKRQVLENEPPIITTTDVVSATIDELYHVDYDAIDEWTPKDQLTWKLNTDASWLSLNSKTGVLTGTPTSSDIGSYWVNVSVLDTDGGMGSHNFTLTVYSESNLPPDINTEDDINAVVGEEYSVDYEADDDRTPIDKLQWSLETNTSDWLSIDPKTGVLSGTPELEDVGSYWVKISVFDGEDGWDYSVFTLYVTTEPITKLRPELSNPEMTPTDGDTNIEFTFSVDYSHPEGDLPDSIQVVIDGSAFDMNSSNGHYEYSTKLSEGTHTYCFTTTLGELTVSTENFTIPYITKAEEGNDGKPGDGDDDNRMLYMGIGIIVIIIVVLILLFIFLKRKKPQEEEQVAEEPKPHEPPPAIQPSPQPLESPAPKAVPQVPQMEQPLPVIPIPQPSGIRLSTTPQVIPIVTQPPVIKKPTIEEELEE